MHALLIVKALAIGFIIAIPTGPVGFLCIRETLVHGMRAGFASAAGSVLADLCYTIVVVFGMTSISHLLVQYAIPLRIFGAVFLVIMGVRMLRSAMHPVGHPEHDALPSDFASTFLLTITNPTLLATYGIVFTTFGIHAVHSHTSGIIMALGIFAGSIIWWLLSISTISHIHKNYYALNLSLINKLSAWFLISAGAVVLLTVIWPHPILHLKLLL